MSFGATTWCALDAEDGSNARPPPTALLGIAGAVLASLCVVTLSKWSREAAKRRTKELRAASRNPEEITAQKAKAAAKAKSYPLYTIEDVKPHCTVKDAWVVVGDGIYDVTKWAPHHPGGERNIVDISGRYGLLAVLCSLLPSNDICVLRG